MQDDTVYNAFCWNIHQRKERWCKFAGLLPELADLIHSWASSFCSLCDTSFRTFVPVTSPSDQYVCYTLRGSMCSRVASKLIHNELCFLKLHPFLSKLLATLLWKKKRKIYTEYFVTRIHFILNFDTFRTSQTVVFVYVQFTI